MTAPLREPFFLRDRTSVLQRAVIMSLVLTGLTAVAGWLMAMTITAAEAFVDFGAELNVLRVVTRAVVALLCGVIATSTIYAPLNHWNNRSGRWTLAAIPAFAVILELMSYGLHRAHDAAIPQGLAISLGFLFATAANGLLLIRPRRSHLLAFLLSIGCAIFPGLMMFLLDNPDRIRIPGLSHQATRPIFYAILFGGWFAALAIPWGLPFWWPPEDRYEPATPQPAPPPTAP